MKNDGTCFPSKTTIAAKSGYSLRTIDKTVDQLEAAGFLAVSRSRGRSSNRYQALLTAHEVRSSDDSNHAPHDTQPRTSRTPTAHDVPGKALKANERFHPNKKNEKHDCPMCGPLTTVKSHQRLVEHLENVHWLDPAEIEELLGAEVTPALTDADRGTR